MKYYVNGEAREAHLTQQINRHLNQIDQRISDLEYEKSTRGKKPDISRGEKITLLKESGLLDAFSSLDLSQKTLSKLLGLLINSSPANIEADLSSRHSQDASFRTASNYIFAMNTFKELKMKDAQERTQLELDKMEKNKV